MPTFTTIAAASSLAATGVTTGMSFKQAGEQRRAMLDAQEKADAAMREARKKLDVNVYAALEIPEKAYAQQIEANLIAGAQALQSGIEGEARGAGAIAGMVQGAQTEAMNKISADKEQALYNLQAATAQEEARNRDIGIQMDLGEVEGAQLAAANAQELGAAALQQGMQGVTSLASQASQLAPLFDKSNLRQSDKLYEQYKEATEQNKTLGSYQNELSKFGIVGGTNFAGVKDMKPEEFNAFMSKLDASTLRELNNRGLFGNIKKNPFLQLYNY